MKSLICRCRWLIVAWIALNESDAQQNNENSDAARIQQLLQQRHDALKQRYDAVVRQNEDGSLHAKHVAPALDGLLKAKEELASSKQDKIEICRKRIANLRRGEEIAEKLRKVGAGSFIR
ncbi:hypothetical protein [Novipirellula artificiosorum]|uniref:hypothetical protein n=1 Tax=Novipirellula artificiosorum TaxID=2528016 RepID=UPI0011B55D8A|nr:hypothetical protein [Novipirellula artificiosorum]